ncbi:MAG: YebC/PmpR family DNA-binding transcriptional regulator [Proteobacteria bacterium]|nr:YebC/PmpR family DNA-binding transcriptional regulator [Pseudomonadota bacterium]MBQ9242014.1 YebC/PmpR family DNA-binding transcriptional regulator [Pseudomonadota bacterium]
MSGHNKWSTIKHKKAKTDAARSQSWTKVVRELIVAAQSGTDPEFNSSLRLAIQKAKACNMPKDNIERAIKRGSGEGETVHYDQIVYEGRGAGGVAILIETLTDNKNRTVANVRSMLSKNGGQMGEAGSCAWQFKTVGQISLEGDNLDPDEVMMAALDAGAEDVNEDGTIVTAPSEVAAVSKKLEEAGYKIETMEITRVATTLVSVDEKAAASILKLCGILEDDDDVQNVYTNADISDELMEKLEG